jgi:hypothetical protein
MNEVERLHYYNGRRLEAPDFLLEQRYHLEMRRLLNRELFTPGVVSGLEVTQKSKTRVAIAEGLALDPLGQEIVYHGGELDVPAQPPTTALPGYFLVIRYRENQIPADEDPCLEPGMPRAARIRETPELSWSEQPPNHDYCRRGIGTPFDCGILTAFVRITNACEIEDNGIELSIREFARPTHTSQVSAIALEGEKDIDEDNPKRLHFVVRGGAPSSVELYLWGERFSSLYYTEMGQHAHTLSKIQVGSATTTLAAHTHSLSNHNHSVPAATTSGGGAHGHDLYVDKVGTAAAVPLATGRESTVVTYQYGFAPNTDSQWHSEYAPRGGLGKDYIKSAPTHSHTIPAQPTGGPSVNETGPASAQQASASHTHTFSASIDPTGASKYPVRGAAAYEYLDNLRVVLDGVDVTQEILNRLAPKTDWAKLGDGGNPNHKLNTEGTGSIDLVDVANAIGKPIGQGAHELVFKVERSASEKQQGKPAKGGKVLYNLYVE